MMHRSITRSSIRRLRLIARTEKDLCRRSFSSTTGSNNSDSSSSNNNNTTKYGSNKESIRARAVPFTSAAVGGSSPSWSDISVGRSSSVSSNNKTKSINRKKNSISSRFMGKSSSYSNHAGSSSNLNNNNNIDEQLSEPEFRSVYVHPLSQIVLEYLQDSHHDWIVSKGLDRSLTLHRDGSFELKDASQPFSSPPLPPMSTTSIKNNQKTTNVEPIISTSTSPTAVMNNDKGKELTNTAAATTTTPSPSKFQQQMISGDMRIWTSYDEQEKKHWLTVRRGLFRQRFLLQDNLLTAWQGNRGVSLAERLQVAVDEMIRAIDRLDQQQKQQQQQRATIGQQQWHQKGQRRFRKR